MAIRLSTKGSIVIPAELRSRYGLKAGSEVRVVDYGGVLAIVPVPADPIAAGLGLTKGGDSLCAAILEEQRHERAQPGAGGVAGEINPAVKLPV